MQIELTEALTIEAHETRYMRPNDAFEDLWSARLYVLNKDIASVGCNGEGRYRTKRAAILAAVKKARGYGYNLTIKRNKLAA